MKVMKLVESKWIMERKHFVYAVKLTFFLSPNCVFGMRQRCRGTNHTHSMKKLLFIDDGVTLTTLHPLPSQLLHRLKTINEIIAASNGVCLLCIDLFIHLHLHIRSRLNVKNQRKFLAAFSRRSLWMPYESCVPAHSDWIYISSSRAFDTRSCGLFRCLLVL